MLEIPARVIQYTPGMYTHEHASSRKSDLGQQTRPPCYLKPAASTKLQGTPYYIRVLRV